MAGSVVISQNNVWTIGLHGFLPIVERIRAAYPAQLDEDDASIFSSMDEGFDFIGVEKLSQNRFMNFVRVVEQQLSQFSNDNSIDGNWRVTLVKSWEEFLNQLHQDPRYRDSVT